MFAFFFGRLSDLADTAKKVGRLSDSSLSNTLQVVEKNHKEKTNQIIKVPVILLPQQQSAFFIKVTLFCQLQSALR